MPTSNPQINDPEGQSVMDAWIEAGVEPSRAYNATQGIHNMSSDKVITEIGALRAEVTAQIGALRAEVTARIDALEAATSARLDAVDAQITLLTWAVIATFAIVTGLAATGFFRMSGWWTRGSSGSESEKAQPTDG